MFDAVNSCMSNSKRSIFDSIATRQSTFQPLDDPYRSNNFRSLPRILHNILDWQSSNELPLRIMFSFNAGMEQSIRINCAHY
jgi:hypothetical protein